jgi:hypothetical protein
MPVQVPANFLDRAGVEVDTARDGVDARFVFDSMTRFGFGLADCSGAGVGLSTSEIGAGSRCGAANQKHRTMKAVRDRFTVSCAQVVQA